MNAKVRRWVVFGVLVLGLGCLMMIALRGSVVPRKLPVVKEYERWNPELVQLIGEMPVQEGGRLKPFSTWAKYRLYSIHSNEKITAMIAGEKEKILPVEWMLDCIFRPAVADDLPTFNVDDKAVAEKLYINVEGKKKRDFYSYNDIAYINKDQFNDKFIQKFQEQIKANLKQKGEGLAIKGEDRQKTDLINSVWNYRKQIGILEVANSFASLVNLDKIEAETGERPSKEEALTMLENVILHGYINLAQAYESGNQGVIEYWDKAFMELRMMPSNDPNNFTWVSYETAFKKLLEAGIGRTNEPDVELAKKDAIQSFSQWTKIAFIYNNYGQEGLLEELKEMKKNVESRVVARGESLDLVKSEVVYYKRKYFANAQGYFLLAFIFVVALLPAPSSLFGKIMGYLGLASVSVGVLYILFGVIHRGEIMQRYPLGKLYDTILVCTIAAVVVLLFMELLTRRKVCLAVSVVLGLMGMMLAQRFEVGNGADTMQPLQAVLNKDYWLIIHVTCIIIGYAGGLVAAGLSTLYLLARMTGVDEGDKSFRRSMTRMAYGAACFTLIFSLVGTILGGVWANDSWGRFWGWDPKENGALMIVLWFLALLHARMAGFIKEWGVHICMVLSANIIAFSWFGVNFLSTGLHSYGFASGGSGETWLNVYYILNAAIALVAIGFAWYEKEVKKMRRREKELEKSMTSQKSDQALEL